MIQHSYKQSDFDLPELSVSELLKLTHYLDVQKVTNTCLLTIADSELNLRQSSKFYIQRRKGMANVSKSQVHKAKPLEVGKESPAVKSSISKHTFDKHVSQSVKDEQISGMSKIQEARSNEESSKSEGVTKSKRQKVEKIPSKKSSQPQASCQSLKEFQKDSIQQFQDHLSYKTAEKVLLSEFMQTNKSKVFGEVSPKSSGMKSAKTQKCGEKSNPVEASLLPDQSHQVVQSKQQQPHKEEDKDGKESLSSNIKYPKSALKVTPQKQSTRSKGKSKTKTPKQSSFYKPTIKINGSDIYGPQKLQAIPSQAIFLDYSAKDNHNRPHQKKTIKQTNIFKKKINIKCQERIPIQLLPSSPESQSPNYKESEVEEKYYEPDYSKYHSYIIPQPDKQLFSDQREKLSPEKSYMDFYAIDISPCKVKGLNQGKSQMDIIELPTSLASKLKEEEIQKIGPSPQSQPKSKPSKSSRKKIFEVLPSKPTEPPSSLPNLQSDSLNSQQLRLLLGVKGNKYKQAIILQYIKQTRRCKVK